MNVVKFTSLLCLVVLSSSSFAYEVSTAGYLKSFLVHQEKVHHEGINSGNETLEPQQLKLENSLRLMVGAQTESGHDVELHYDINPTFYGQQKPALTRNNSASLYRLADLRPDIENSNRVDVTQNLDRLNAQIHFENGDLTLGRQAITFGSARVINPMDIFIPFGLQTLNTEYRSGIDALRYQHYLDDFSIIDMGVILGEDALAKNSAAYVRMKNSIDGNDLEFIVIKLEDVELYGGGLQRSLGDMGGWLETTYISARKQGFWRSSIGVDYAFNEDIYTMVEYHYNGMGADNIDEYVQNSQTALYQKMGVTVLGRHYLMPSVSVTVSPLLTVTGSLTTNIEDASSLLQVASEVSWSENQYSQFGAYKGIGKGMGEGMSREAPNAQAGLGSEFGATPLMLYVSYAVYF